MVRKNTKKPIKITRRSLIQVAKDYLNLSVEERPVKLAEIGDFAECSGTPVDCVKLALDQFYKDRRPDLVIGGINHGDNSSVNNHYSGTMGVAKEGCMQHIPSIAFSSCNYDENADLSPLRDGVAQVVKMVLEKGLPKYTCLNVNFPAQPPFKGFKACRMTHGCSRYWFYYG